MEHMCYFYGFYKIYCITKLIFHWFDINSISTKWCQFIIINKQAAISKLNKYLSLDFRINERDMQIRDQHIKSSRRWVGGYHKNPLEIVS